MTILAVDTTSTHGSVAVRVNGQVAAEVHLESTTGFSPVLFQAIESCKNEAKIDLQQVDCFAAASGPGSFTGVRVGLSAVKGLAQAMGKPALGVSNLRAIASFGEHPKALKAVLIDARRGEVYAGVYDKDLRCVQPETVAPLAIWLQRLEHDAKYELISAIQLDLNEITFQTTGLTKPSQFLAGAVAFCAELDEAAGKWLDPEAVDANYVRRSDAELFWSEA